MRSEALAFDIDTSTLLVSRSSGMYWIRHPHWESVVLLKNFLAKGWYVMGCVSVLARSCCEGSKPFTPGVRDIEALVYSRTGFIQGLKRCVARSTSALWTLFHFNYLAAFRSQVEPRVFYDEVTFWHLGLADSWSFNVVINYTA